MTLLPSLKESLARWIDVVAGAMLSAAERWVAPRRVVLTEDDDGAFTLSADDARAASAVRSSRLRIVDGAITGGLAPATTSKIKGARIELILQPGKFLFRPLELPGRAGEFLDGIVRAQIDRLTPWAAADAAFGWSQPVKIASDRIVLTVAATPRTLLAPVVQAIVESGAHSVVVFTRPSAEPQLQPIKVLEQFARGTLDLALIRRVLSTLVVGAGLTAAAATVATVIIGAYLDAQRENVARQVTEMRSSLRSGRNLSGSATGALRALERRKSERPSPVIVLEALSRILPDGTYVTELRMDGDKLQLAGVSRDAASLIRLIEQSPHFVRATFSAPTTRAAGDAGDLFHIEVTIRPVFVLGT